jgi:hypothetical protein
LRCNVSRKHVNGNFVVTSPWDDEVRMLHRRAHKGLEARLDEGLVLVQDRLNISPTLHDIATEPASQAHIQIFHREHGYVANVSVVNAAGDAEVGSTPSRCSSSPDLLYV